MDGCCEAKTEEFGEDGRFLCVGRRGNQGDIVRDICRSTSFQLIQQHMRHARAMRKCEYRNVTLGETSKPITKPSTEGTTKPQNWLAAFGRCCCGNDARDSRC